MTHHKVFSLVLVLAGALAFGAAQGQTKWPEKPTRIIVPFPAGGSTDVVARIIAQRLTDRYGQSFVVENRPGAGGNIGTDAVAKAAPDGYTLAQSTSGPLANNKFLYKSMGYDPEKDLSPIILVGEIPLVIAANPGVPASNLREFVELARKQPGKLNAGSPGNGTIGHLALELLKTVTRIDFVIEKDRTSLIRSAQYAFSTLFCRVTLPVSMLAFKVSRISLRFIPSLLLLLRSRGWRSRSPDSKGVHSRGHAGNASR